MYILVPPKENDLSSWSEWSVWGLCECNAEGDNQQSRHRHCDKDATCEGQSVETRQCDGLCPGMCVL